MCTQNLNVMIEKSTTSNELETTQVENPTVTVSQENSQTSDSTSGNSNDSEETSSEPVIQAEQPAAEIVEFQAEESVTINEPETVSQPELAITQNDEAESSVPVIEETIAVEEHPLTNEIVADSEVKEEVQKEIEQELNTEDSIQYVDISAYSKEELIEYFKTIIEQKQIQDIKDEVDNIKINFYKKHNAEIADKKRQFTEEGNEPVEFKVEPDLLEAELKELIKKYKELKTSFNEQLEKEKQDNLKRKYELIEDIKKLIDGNESINRTFQEFRELQKRWREIGPVPQSDMNNLWETYNHHVEAFYDFIKINKELRDLDFKRNLEAKVRLCEKTEELMMEPSIKIAFNVLQKYHTQWREIGPVPLDKRDDVWERFKQATSTINKKYHEYIEKLKQEEQNNLDAKILLCEKAEEIAGVAPKTHNEWEEKSAEVMELQKIWRRIGFAPKKENNKVYIRFRSACDEFFNKKRDYYGKLKEEQNLNLQLKTELCLQAEAMKDSTEWKKSTEEYIKIQERWKTIGPVPRKHSEQIWQRFRTACNIFFDKKSNHFASVDKVQDDNLSAKKELIEEVKAYTLSDNADANMEKFKEYQKRWTDIGHVPFKYKDELQKEFRDAIRTLFDSFEIDEYQKGELRFKSKLKTIQQSGKSQSKMRFEREKLVSKLEKVQDDILIWENNIGFFAKSKNAEALIEDVTRKIFDARKMVDSLKERLSVLDKYEE